MLRMPPLRACLAIVATVALGVIAALLMPSHARVPQPAGYTRALSAAGRHSASHGRISSNDRTRAMLDAPTCQAEAGQVSAVISITLNNAGPYFSQSCYYAPVNQAFTVHFANTIFNAADKSPLSLTLVISPSQNPYRVPVSGRPGWAISSSAN